MNVRLWILLGLLAIASLTAPAAAQFPEMTAPTTPVRPSIPQGLQLTPQSGTWLICAASFSGDEAVPLAIKMANTLRERDRLPTYVINHGENERQKQIQEYEELKKRNPGMPVRPRFTRIQEHAAVVIGGYADVDKATAALPRIKKLTAPDLRLASGAPAYDSVVNYEPSTGGTQVKKALVNPFSTAFVTRNPTAPKPAQADRAREELKFLRSMNANEDYSLFKCKGNYTLVIKEYTGASMYQSQQNGPKGEKTFLQSIGLSGSNDILTASAMQAHELAKFLRNYNFDTYVLHTRQSSIVSVGGFDSPDDEKLKRMQQQLAGMRFQGGVPLELLPSPMPMPIPR